MTEHMIPDPTALPVSGEWSNPADPAAELAPDPSGDKLIGDSYMAPVDNPLHRAVLCGALNGHGQRCGRRQHPDHWQHFEIVDNRITAAWGTGRHHRGVPVDELLAAAEQPPIPADRAAELATLAYEVKDILDSALAAAVDPLAHVQVGDADPLIPEEDRDWPTCGASGPIEHEVIPGVKVRASCDRPPHPAHWQHIAVDVDEVAEVWHGDHGPTRPVVPPAEAAPVVDAVDQLLADTDHQLVDVPTQCPRCGAPATTELIDISTAVEHARDERKFMPGRSECSARCWETPTAPASDAHGLVEIDEVRDEPFDDERLAHVQRAADAAATIYGSILDIRRRSVLGGVVLAFGALSPDDVAALPGDLLVALERTVAALCQPLAPDTIDLIDSVRAGAVR